MIVCTLYEHSATKFIFFVVWRDVFICEFSYCSFDGFYGAQAASCEFSF